MIVETEIDTDGPGFRAAVAMRRCALAFRDLAEALDLAERQEIARWAAIRARRAARQRAFAQAVAEAIEAPTTTKDGS